MGKMAQVVKSTCCSYRGLELPAPILGGSQPFVTLAPEVLTPSVGLLGQLPTCKYTHTCRHMHNFFFLRNLYKENDLKMLWLILLFISEFLSYFVCFHVQTYSVEPTSLRLSWFSGWASFQPS